MTARTFYDEVGGHPTIARIIHRFYQGVASDAELRAIYPHDDLGPAEHRLTMFFEQFWGGPTTYSDQRGHPRLGMRHAPFAVTPRAARHWLDHMRVAIEESGMDAEHQGQFWEYVVRAAHFLVNSPGDNDDEPEGPKAQGRRSGEGPPKPSRPTLPLT